MLTCLGFKHSAEGREQSIFVRFVRFVRFPTRLASLTPEKEVKVPRNRHDGPAAIVGKQRALFGGVRAWHFLGKCPLWRTFSESHD